MRYRNEDLPLFIDQFLAETNAELDKNVHSPDEAALAALLNYNWPGNIRELKNVIRRACLLCPDQFTITTEYLPGELLRVEQEQDEKMEKDTLFSSRQKKPRDISLKEIQEALKVSNYNKSKAAHYLGIDRKTLYNRLKTEQSS